MKEPRLVLVYIQKLLPVTWYLLVPFHVPSDTSTSFLRVAAFRVGPILQVCIKHHIHSLHVTTELFAYIFHDLRDVPSKCDWSSWLDHVKNGSTIYDNHMFKSIHGLVPNYLCDEITMQRDIAERTTRSTIDNNVHVPHITLECCKNAFAYRGPVLLNALPENIKKCESLNGFKQCLKLHVVGLLMPYFCCMYNCTHYYCYNVAFLYIITWYTCLYVLFICLRCVSIYNTWHQLYCVIIF